MMQRREEIPSVLYEALEQAWVRLEVDLTEALVRSMG